VSNGKLYVDGRSEAASDSELRDLLRTYGTVEHAYVVRYKRSVKSAGYGFVEMGSREDALRAISALDGAMFEDNRLRVFLTAPPRPKFYSAERRSASAFAVGSSWHAPKRPEAEGIGVARPYTSSIWCPLLYTSRTLQLRLPLLSCRWGYEA